MHKTLLLCFIHGFKGGDDTFSAFPDHLRELLTAALPNISIRTIVYPKYETRGDLTECVSKFREWLLEKVIDIEVANKTSSPTVDPSVRTILIGHSMGGIVAAETVLALTSDAVVSASDGIDASTLMFPYIQGVLAFDTPYLGIAPGVVAHGAEGHYRTASDAISGFTAVSDMFWGSKAKAPDAPLAALPAATSAGAAASGWGKWGKIAAYTGAATAVAAGGAMAYMKRGELTEGWSWVGSHLLFVGCLMRGEELKKRVERVIALSKERGIGFANQYTRLGAGAKTVSGISVAKTVMGSDRTFCNLPKSDVLEYFHGAVNEKAADEVAAHITMFMPNDNPGYKKLTEHASELISHWTTNDWYESSTPEGGIAPDEVGH